VSVTVAKEEEEVGRDLIWGFALAVAAMAAAGERGSEYFLLRTGRS
jgi:hypothetical protein